MSLSNAEQFPLIKEDVTKHLNTLKRMLNNGLFVLNIDLMLNTLEYILPLCSLYRMVIISVDRWTKLLY